ncbi:hypothetical protein WI215_11725 [Salmonella enterica subsp. enterica serovar Infantis]
MDIRKIISVCIQRNTNHLLERILICYLEMYPVISDDDDEVYPEFVINNSLELFFYGDQFLDVLRNISTQKENPSMEDFIAGLNFYLENDNFIDF